MVRKHFDEDERELIGYGWRWGKLLLATIVVLGVCGLVWHTCMREATDAADVAHEEFGARALLEKYRYFKRVAASIEAKSADIDVLEQRSKTTVETYGKDASKWPRDVRESHVQDADALASLKLSFNKLAAEYNTAMSDKFTAFTNVGDLPRGWPSDERVPLKREYTPYKVQ